MTKQTIPSIFTLQEAAKIWNISYEGLRRRVIREPNKKKPLFKKGEIHKSGWVWLITGSAMERLYGPHK